MRFWLGRGEKKLHHEKKTSRINLLCYSTFILQIKKLRCRKEKKKKKGKERNVQGHPGVCTPICFALTIYGAAAGREFFGMGILQNMSYCIKSSQQCCEIAGILPRRKLRLREGKELVHHGGAVRRGRSVTPTHIWLTLHVEFLP